MSGFGTGSNSNGQFWFGGSSFPGFLYKKNAGVGGRRSTKFNPGGNITCNSPTYLYNKYKPGAGGIGASSTSNRRAKNRLATICSSQQCFPCFNTLGQYSNYTHNPNGFIPCPANAVNNSVTPTPIPIVTFNVTYFGNGSTSGSPPIDANSYNSGSLVTILGNIGTPVLTRAGFTFAGWKINNTGTTYVQGNTFTINANTILYAQWTPNPSNTFNVTYFRNGSTSGSPPVDGSRYNFGSLVTILGNTRSLARARFTFAGWKINNTGTTYVQGNTFNITQDTTLYAQWTPIPLNVTYFGTGSTSGSPPIDTSSPYNSGDPVTILGQGSLTKTDYTFAGWNTALNGSGTPYSPGDTFNITQDTNLFAQWTQNPITYNVTYLGTGSTGGSVPTDPNSYAASSSVTILGQGSLTKTGYTFAGWKINNTGTTYAAGNTFNITANTTLFAQWTLNPITSFNVIYDGNGNTAGSPPSDGSSPYNPGSSVTVLTNASITTFQPTFIKSGYTFGGWNTAPDGSGINYIGGSTFTINANTTLYANWRGGGNVGLFYRAGTGGTGTPPPSSGTYYNAYTSQPIVGNTGLFTRTGFTFGGWNTATNGSGTSYPAGSNITIPGSTIVLVAQWIPDAGPNVNLTYNANSANGGQGADVTNSYSTNSAATISGQPGSFTNTDPNKIFYGWNTATDGTGTSYSAGSYITMNSSKTLYAQWVSNASPYQVTYDANDSTGGSVPAAPTNYPAGVQVSILGPGSLTKPGYSFLGWNGSFDGTGSVYAPGYTFMSKTTTLYALWAPGSPVKNCGGGGTGGTAGLASIFYFFPFAQIIQSSDTITIYTTALLSATSSNYGTGTAPLGITSIASMTIIKSSTIKINTNTSFLTSVNDNYYSKIITNGIDSNYWPLGASILNITYSAIGDGNSSIPTYNTSTRYCGANGCGLSANAGSSSGVITAYSFYNQSFTINFSTGSSTFIANSPTNVLYTASTSLPLNWVSAPKNRYPYGDVLDTSGNVQSSHDALTAITIIPFGGSTYISPAMPNNTLQFNGNGATSGSIPNPTYFAPYNSSGPTSVAVGGNTGALKRTDTATLNEFVFTKWNTAADGSGTNYGPGGFATSYLASSGTNILYAQWTPGYYVKYSNNTTTTTGTGGSVTDTSSPYLLLNPSTLSPYVITVKPNGFTWTGYTMLSWNTAADGTGTTYSAAGGQTFSLTANVILYAQWSP